jgi:hypothetical protein
MPRLSRRKFLKDTAIAGLGTALAAKRMVSAPSVLTPPKTATMTAGGEVIFRPSYVQRGRGPHLLDWAYASDEQWDAFKSNITSTRDGVSISDTGGRKKFSVEVRWNVEGFGYLFLTADNGGDLYELPPSGVQRRLNLNQELARSRVTRNRRRLTKHTATGWTPSREAHALVALSEEFLEDAERREGGEEQSGALAQRALLHALRASELMEIEKARDEIVRLGPRHGFLAGCDARAMYEMDKDLFLERFAPLFNYATVGTVWKGSQNLEDWEPEEGTLIFGQRDLMVQELSSRGITVEARPLFWFHTWVTPDWIRQKSYDRLLAYVERTTRAAVSHFGDRLYAWELVNELHDWANECGLNRDQTVELTRLACDVAKATAPRVHRLVNNCCPYAEYVQLGRWSGQEARYPQRTPWQFTKDLADAGVEFTLLGQQMYFPYRDLQDIVLLIERFEAFRKPLHLSEIGAPGGPTEYSIKLGKSQFPKEPYAWRRPWDEELQADWLEAVYTLALSKPFIEGAHWFDFVDPYAYIENGGLLRSPGGEPKSAYDRLLALRNRWGFATHRPPHTVGDPLR